MPAGAGRAAAAGAGPTAAACHGGPCVGVLGCTRARLLALLMLAGLALAAAAGPRTAPSAAAAAAGEQQRGLIGEGGEPATATDHVEAAGLALGGGAALRGLKQAACNVANCTTCVAGKPNQCANCVLGYEKTAQNRCKNCTAPGQTRAVCNKYALNQCTCLECKAGFGPMPNKGKCLACTVAGCTSYSAGCTCSGCSGGYALNNRGTCDKANRSGSLKPSRCAAALKCRLLLTEVLAPPVLQCNNVGQRATECQRNAADCGCTTCKQGYSLSSGAKLAKSSALKTCSQCKGTRQTITECSAYNDNTCTCKACKPGFTLDSKAGSCPPCAATRTTTECSAFKQGTQCTCTACNAGYSLSKDGACTPCAGARSREVCASYEVAGKCDCKTCNAGYVLKSKQCPACPTNQSTDRCTGYKAAGTSCECTGCKGGGWRLDKGACQPCPTIPNCETGAFRADCTCSKCNQYFASNDGGQSCKCTLTNPNPPCAKRDANQCSCQTCANGYRSNGAGGCAPVPSPPPPPPPSPPPPRATTPDQPVDVDACPDVIRIDKDIANSTILNTNTLYSAGDCCDACTLRLGCLFWTFQASRNLCTLHAMNAGIQVVDAPSSMAGGILCPSDRHLGIDLTTRGQAPVGTYASFTTCCRQCSLEDNCWSWSYNVKTKQCWHHGWSFTPTLTPAADVVSANATIDSSFVRHFTLDDAEFVGAPIHTAWMLDEGACWWACHSTTPKAGEYQQQLPMDPPRQCMFSSFNATSRLCKLYESVQGATLLKPGSGMHLGRGMLPFKRDQWLPHTGLTFNDPNSPTRTGISIDMCFAWADTIGLNAAAYDAQTRVCRLFSNARLPVVPAGSEVVLAIKYPTPLFKINSSTYSEVCWQLGCTVQTGLTFAPASLLRAQPVADLPYCCLWCLEDSACGSWSYDPATRGCTLFSRGAAVTQAASADVVSGALPDMAECVGDSWDACTVTRNAVFVGQELPQSGPMELGHPGKCCQLCKQTVGCTAWTYIAHRGTCTLWSSISQQIDAPPIEHAWSGVLREEGALATCPFTIRRNVDLVPPGTRGTPRKATSTADCCSQADGLGAVAWSYHPTTGNCYLSYYNSGYTHTPAGGVISGAWAGSQSNLALCTATRRFVALRSKPPPTAPQAVTSTYWFGGAGRCCTACNLDLRCRGWLWDPQTGKCTSMANYDVDTEPLYGGGMSGTWPVDTWPLPLAY